MSKFFKRKIMVVTVFSLIATGLMLGANAQEQQAQKPSTPESVAPDVNKVANASLPADAKQAKPVFLPEFTEFEKKFHQQLNENVEADFKDTPLSEVMKSYEKATGANLVVFANDLGEEGLTVDEPVTLSLKKVSLKTALDLILKPLGLTYVVDRDIVKVTTVLKAEEVMKTRVYPVADFGDVPEDYVALEVAIRNAGLGNWREPKAETTPQQPAQATGSGGGFGGGGGSGFFQFGGAMGGGLGGGFNDAGMGFRTPLYEEGYGGTISVVPQSQALVITQTYEAHNAIVELLTLLRAARVSD